MTPAEALERILPTWRSSLPPELAPDVDAFVRRRRAALERILGQALGVRRLQRGKLPRTVEDFSAAGFLAERERPHLEGPDRDLLRRLKKRTTTLLAGVEDPAAARGVYDEYVLLRAEALLLGQMGWDAVSLLLRQPMLAIFSAKSVVLVHRHGPKPHDAIFPGLEEASVADLRADLEAAHGIAIEIHTQITERGGGPETIWARARGRAAELLRDRARVVCRRCGAHLRQPERHYAIGTIECPAGEGECISVEQDAEERRLGEEQARQRRAEDPHIVPPVDHQADLERRRKEQADKAWRKSEQRRRREEREREKEATARRRQQKAHSRAEERIDLDAEEWFEAGELPRTPGELDAYRRFAERERPDEDQDDEALIAWVARRRDALLGRRPDLDTQEAAITAEHDFVRLRAEAIVLRALGYQAIPVMLMRSSLTATIGDEALVHRHFPPELAVASRGEVTRFDYFADAPTTIAAVQVLREVHAHIERLRVEIGGMDLEVVAPALWQAARDLAATVKTTEPDADEREALEALLAPEPVDRFGRMVHETRWASRAAAIRQLERAGFRFIKTRSAAAAAWPEGFWSRFPRTAVVKGATVQVTAAP